MYAYACDPGGGGCDIGILDHRIIFHDV